MFVLVKISDVIKISPDLFGLPHEKVLTEEIDRKYANKVVADVGLCITLYDFISIGDAVIHPCHGASHTEVEFRMIAFRPFIGEVIVGKLVRSTPEHIRVSTEFSHDIIIPSYNLQSPSVFNQKEQLWVWKYSDSDDEFFMDLNEEVRIRITQVKYTKVTRTAKGVQATTTETEKDKSSNNESARQRRSSSVDLSEADRCPSALQLVGTINEDGLGMTSWWS